MGVVPGPRDGRRSWRTNGIIKNDPIFPEKEENKERFLKNIETIIKRTNGNCLKSRTNENGTI